MENIEKAKKSSVIGNFVWTFVSLILLILLVLKVFVYQQVTVVGSSMSPTYENGDLLMVNQISENFQRGQVVAVYANADVAKNANPLTRYSARFFLKRIIGLPGEEIEIIDSNVIIYNNQFPRGVVLNEPYISFETKATEAKRNFYFERKQIPEGKYFVMGDNRSNSTDSRSDQLGPVNDFAIFGVESFRFWPASSVETFALPRYEFSQVDPAIEKRREEVKDLKSFSNTRTFQFQISE